jgi:hypothetical protein
MCIECPHTGASLIFCSQLSPWSPTQSSKILQPASSEASKSQTEGKQPDGSHMVHVTITECLTYCILSVPSTRVPRPATASCTHPLGP